MADFDGAPYRGTNCHLMGSKSYVHFFCIFLQLYTLKINKYTSISGHNSYEEPILTLKWALKGKPQGLESQKTKKYTSLVFNFILSSGASRAISLGDWLLLVESTIARSWRPHASSWEEMDIFALDLFQRSYLYAFQRTSRIKNWI